MQNLKGFRNTSTRGECAEAIVMARFMEAGFSVSRPFGGSSRYDLIVDTGDEFLKIQIKVGRLEKGCVTVKRYTETGAGRENKHYYSKDEVDYLAIYCYELGETYIVPVGETVFYLRVIPAKNGQKKGINYAADYEFKTWVKNEKDKVNKREKYVGRQRRLYGN